MINKESQTKVDIIRNCQSCKHSNYCPCRLFYYCPKDKRPAEDRVVIPENERGMFFNVPMN
jgi:hypothetical protein